MSNTLGRYSEKDVVVVESPQNIGAAGAAACIAAGMGLVNSMKDVKKLIPVKTTYHPNTSNRAAYERNFKVFKNLYKCNKQNFKYSHLDKNNILIKI